MLFPTVAFSLFFLAFLALWWTLPAQAPKARAWVLLLGNVLFYAWMDLRWAGGLIGLGTAAWMASYWIAQSKTGSGARRAKGWISVMALLAALFALKYVPWLGHMYNSWGQDWGWKAAVFPEWVYPAGLSFFTFHALAIVLGVWHDRIKLPAWLGTVAHVSFFPTLLAGPVLRPGQVMDRLNERFDFREAAWGEGVSRFAVGMSFKWVLATQAAAWADPVFQGLYDSRGSVWWGVHAYGFQIFFDFAGYSLMAIGLAMMMGFTLTENFTQPYTARTIGDFWRRWHRSLSFFFRDHLYIDALGGSRHGKTRAILAAAATMLVSGMWHGASLMFLAWGAWHAAVLIVERVIPGRERWPAVLGWLLTFELAMWGWVWFRSDTWDTAKDIFARAWGSAGGTETLGLDAWAWLWAGVMIVIVLTEKFWLGALLEKARELDRPQVSVWAQAFSVVLLVGWAWALMALGPEGVPNFIYNGF